MSYIKVALSCLVMTSEQLTLDISAFQNLLRRFIYFFQIIFILFENSFVERSLMKKIQWNPNFRTGVTKKKKLVGEIGVKMQCSTNGGEQTFLVRYPAFSSQNRESEKRRFSGEKKNCFLLPRCTNLLSSSLVCQICKQLPHFFAMWLLQPRPDNNILCELTNESQGC